MNPSDIPADIPIGAEVEMTVTAKYMGSLWPQDSAIRAEFRTGGPVVSIPATKVSRIKRIEDYQDGGIYIDGAGAWYRYSDKYSSWEIFGSSTLLPFGNPQRPLTRVQRGIQ